MTGVAATRSVWQFDAIGTAWQIETIEPLPEPVRRDVLDLIDRFDRDWSRFREDSLVTALASHAGAVTAPPDAAAMLDAFDAASEATHGAVNPLIGDALAHRGYDRDYSFVDRGPLPTTASWRAVLGWRDGELSLTEPALIDVGALGKGRLADRVAEVLREHGVASFVVDASGDVVIDDMPERIGLEHPFDPTRAIGIWELNQGALCASATNRRAWGSGMHHVLDARTGKPVRTIAATWAVADTAMRADAVATALFFEGGEALAAAWNAQWVRVTTDGRLERSRSATVEVFA